MTIFIVSLMSFYFVTLLLIFWWTCSVIRQQRNNDLRHHREVLLGHIQNELALQQTRLVDRLRALK